MTNKKNEPASPHANHVMVLDIRSADGSARDARIQFITAVGNPRYPGGNLVGEAGRNEARGSLRLQRNP